MLLSSKNTHDSVFSVAGWPSFGSCWRKSPMAGVDAYTSSSSLPSTRMGLPTRTALTVTCPATRGHTTHTRSGTEETIARTREEICIEERCYVSELHFASH